VSSSGIKILGGAPANPVREIMVDAIRQIVAQVPGTFEAYLPLCLIEGDQEARQVLLVGVDPRAAATEVMEDLGEKMKLLLPEREFIDIVPLPPSSPLLALAATRVPSTLIFKRKRRPWWRIW